MDKTDNFVIIIFGASGDLASRKLIPSLFELFQRKLLSANFKILGVGRTSFSDESFKDKIYTILKKLNIEDNDILNKFIDQTYYFSIDSYKKDEYLKLKDKLKGFENETSFKWNYLYYLATPPLLYEKIIEGLDYANINNEEEDSWKRIIIEKPFGYDLESAQKLNTTIHKHFNENQVYRIDHYLGKETVQNIIAFRFANSIFEPLWNRNYIHHVEITAAESIGIENRGGYYDKAGALRDMVQNHLLQLVALTAMEPPASFNADTVRNETLKIFESISPIDISQLNKFVIRGQYTESNINNKPILSYRDEDNVTKDSRADTFIAIKLFIDNWRWADVPFYLRTGKRLPTKATEIVIHFKRAPQILFSRPDPCCLHGNQLIIRIQPDEGILLKIGMKMPGSGFNINDVDMNFKYSDLSNIYLPDSYERLLLDSIQGDATLFSRSDNVEACWKFIDPILKAWEQSDKYTIYGYPAGTWGPIESKRLFDNTDEDWRYPCKNLISNGIYCEL